MLHRSLAISFALALPMSAGLLGCSSLSSKKEQGLSRVDELLTSVERVQAEALLAKDRSREALELLRVIVAPDFNGDPVASYARVVDAIDAAQRQTRKLESAVEPLEETADDVFRAWTKELESYGNTRLRRQSQARMAATRARYEIVHRSLLEAQIACESFDADIEDHARFLEHDFNAESVAAIADEVSLLDEQAQELALRLDACIDASKSYVETAALRGQLAQDATEVTPRSQRVANGEGAPRRRAKQQAAAPTPEGEQTAPVAQKDN